MAGRFVVVGALGFVVQLAVFSVLSRMGCPWLASTVVAVESAIAHNFVWHRWWTWRHRIANASWFHEFVKFNTGTAFTSILGNVAVMTCTPLSRSDVPDCRHWQWLDVVS